eukprot:210446-Amphidinium_carterae.1
MHPEANATEASVGYFTTHERAVVVSPTTGMNCRRSVSNDAAILSTIGFLLSVSFTQGLSTHHAVKGLKSGTVYAVWVAGLTEA